jgi:O-antigen/teichoic acid export membrane protein
MARMLSVSDYGILATLFSMIYIMGIFSESIQLVITKYSSNEKNKGKLKNIFLKSTKKALKVSLGIFVFYLAISLFLTPLLKIPYSLLVLNGTIIFSSFLLPITRGLLQGQKRFGSLGINVVIESVVKLILAIVLVFIGWKVYGAIVGAIFGVGFAFVFSIVSIRDIVKTKKISSKTPGIYGYTKPAFFIMFFILLFYSADIILAKIVFPEEIAGAYAIASILGKTIFFGTQPISRAMFPISAENPKKEGQNKVFEKSLFLLILLIIIALAIFFFAPELIIKVFSGKIIPQATKILFLVGISTSLLSITNLVLLYKLSTGNFKGYQYLGILLLVELFLLFYFSGNLTQFSIAFITASSIFLWGSIHLVGKD